VHRYGVELNIAGHFVLELTGSGRDKGDFLRRTVCRYPDLERKFAPFAQAQKTLALPKGPGHWKPAKNDSFESARGVETIDTGFTYHSVGPRIQEQRLVDMPIRLFSTLEDQTKRFLAFDPGSGCGSDSNPSGLIEKKYPCRDNRLSDYCSGVRSQRI